VDEINGFFGRNFDTGRLSAIVSSFLDGVFAGPFDTLLALDLKDLTDTVSETSSEASFRPEGVLAVTTKEPRGGVLGTFAPPTNVADILGFVV